MARPRGTGGPGDRRGGEHGVGRIDDLPPKSPFRRAFEAYVDKYRWRAENWDPIVPTVGENPGRVLSLVRRAMDAPKPQLATAAGEARRLEAVRHAEAALADHPAPLARFREIVAALNGYVGVREGRALWQLIATGSLRHALLARGRVLVDGGMVEAPDDIFFLLPEEVDAGTSGRRADHRPLVTRRRREWESWRTKRPPMLIGADPVGPLPIPPPIVSAGLVLRGVPASRGVVTAPVRVVSDLSEVDAFQPGEVLVCTMTSPPWTPLFTIAAAVVTESGAPLSHPAITAREYGIPCVVAAKDATRKLRTGMRVTVDGLAGTITILEPDDS